MSSLQLQQSGASTTTEELIAWLMGGPEGVERWNKWRKDGGEPPNLSGREFKDVKLRRANLSGMHLDRVNFEGADFERADLSATSLQGSNLKRTNLNNADLSDANLTGAHLLLARLHDANVTRAILTSADLTRTEFVGACVHDAFLNGAKVDRTNFHSVRLQPKQLTRADWWSRIRDRVTWNSVRAIGALHLLTRASYFVLLLVPVLAGFWNGVYGLTQMYNDALLKRASVFYKSAAREREQADATRNAGQDASVHERRARTFERNAGTLERAVLELHLPVGWALAFVAALAIAAGHLIYQLACPMLLKENSAADYVQQRTREATSESASLVDEVRGAQFALNELARRLPTARHSQLVERHGRVIYFPNDESFYGKTSLVGPVEKSTVRIDPRILIEEGARAEYTLKSVENHLWAWVSLLLYFVAGLLIVWNIAIQTILVGRAVNWW